MLQQHFNGGYGHGYSSWPHGVQHRAQRLDNGHHRWDFHHPHCPSYAVCRDWYRDLLQRDHVARRRHRHGRSRDAHRQLHQRPNRLTHGGLRGRCHHSSSTSSVVPVAITTSTTSSSSCDTSIPAVTEGPYWTDDSASGYNRSNITSDLAGTNTQSGVPFVLTLFIYDQKNSCTTMENVQVDIWHCNAAGVYSGIKSNTNGCGTDYTSQSWLRGYQLTDSSGKVAFTTIVPDWYMGRTTHIHIRFRSTYNSSSDGSTNTAQLFFDQTFIDTLDTTVSPYSSEGKNSVTNSGDSVYTSEGGTTLLSLAGSTAAGYTASFSVYLPLS